MKVYLKIKRNFSELEKVSEKQKQTKIELDTFYQIYQISLILMFLMVKMKMIILKS